MPDTTENLSEHWDKLKIQYPIGTIHRLRIIRQKPFGIFLDLGYGDRYRYHLTGIIDIGGRSLPLDYAEWPQVGDQIQVKVVYFREHLKEIDFILYQ